MNKIYGTAKLQRDSKYYECVCTRCGENLKYNIANYCMYCGAKLDAQRRKKADKYSEILQLKNYCEEIGLKCELTRIYDGYKIKFLLGDCVQHSGSYLSDYGYIEFGDCHCNEIKEYEPYTLTKAKEIVKKHKDLLNMSKEDK